MSNRVSGIMLRTLPDLAFLIGLGAVAVGCWWLHPAAGLIVPGGLLLAVVVFGRLRRTPPPAPSTRRLLK